MWSRQKLTYFWRGRCCSASMTFVSSALPRQSKQRNVTIPIHATNNNSWISKQQTKLAPTTELPEFFLHIHPLQKFSTKHLHSITSSNQPHVSATLSASNPNGLRPQLLARPTLGPKTRLHLSGHPGLQALHHRLVVLSRRTHE